MGSDELQRYERHGGVGLKAEAESTSSCCGLLFGRIPLSRHAMPCHMHENLTITIITTPDTLSEWPIEHATAADGGVQPDSYLRLRLFKATVPTKRSIAHRLSILVIS